MKTCSGYLLKTHEIDKICGKCWHEPAKTYVVFSLAPLLRELLNLTYEEAMLIYTKKKKGAIFSALL